MTTIPTPDQTLPGGKIEFIAYHEPVLQAGDYTLTVSQVVETQKTSKIKRDNTFPVTHAFSVSGEQFTLDPTEILSVFPPMGSLGDYSNTFPHLVLKRSTLPWERKLFKDNTALVRPWLALLVFGENETLGVDTPILNTLMSAAKGWPGVSTLIQSKPRGDDRVNVIRVNQELLKILVPSIADLAYTAHVRQGTDDDGKPLGNEQAVIIANRLPRKGSLTTVHLVSLEKRFTTAGFHYDGAQTTDDVMLVSLYSWRFFCPDDEVYRITPSSLEKLKTRDNVPNTILDKLAPLSMQEVHSTKDFFDRVKDALGEPDATTYRNPILKYAAYKKESFKGLLLDINREPSTLRLAPKDNEELDRYLALGSTILPHAFRQGDILMSWYHGPLVPGIVSADISLPVQASDALLRYDPRVGMFDTSYAAAWELGRLLALRNKAFSIPLFNWKRAHAQQLKSGEASLFEHLPYQSGYTSDELVLPDTLQKAFDRLSLLYGVPFNYLVPDERLLPEESIRFFQLDPLWIKCLLDGAFSIGRVTNADHQCDCDIVIATPSIKLKTVSGFLLRSDVVSGWPALQVDGYKDLISHDHFVPEGESLTMRRMERLSSNVLLCLFDGLVQTVDIHLNAETLHFGLDPMTDDDTRYYKELRNNKGEEEADKKVEPVRWRQGAADRRIVDIDGLARDIVTVLDAQLENFTSAQFALEMVEGVEKVRYRMQ